MMLVIALAAALTSLSLAALWAGRRAADYRAIAETGSHVASVLAIAGGAWWFIYTTQFKPRVQFDVDCRFSRLRHNSERLIAEIQLVFENKGFVEHRLWNLNVSVHALESEQSLVSKETTRELKFAKRLLPRVQLVPKKYGYYFVRPGVRQVISHIIDIPEYSSAICLTASFEYNQNRFDLRLMSSLNDIGGIPTEGKNLVIVAAVNNVLHFRFFDSNGKVAVDTDETRLTEQGQQIEDFRRRFERLRPPHKLTRRDKGRVVSAVTSIVGYTGDYPHTVAPGV